MPALPPRHQEPDCENDQADLEQQAKDRRKSADPAKQSTAKQHAEEASAEKAGGKAAQHAHAGPVEETATRPKARARWLGDGAVERLGRVRRGRRTRRRRKGSRTPRPGRGTTADPCIC